MKLVRFSEAVLRQILECTPDGLIIVDQDGVILFCNRRAEELFQYAKDQLIGQSIEILLPSRFAKDHTNLRSGYLTQPRARSMNSGKQLFGRKQDGSEFNVDITLSPIKTEEGLLIASSIRDISKKVKVEIELIKAKQASEQANSAKSEFLANMSHEIRTPMNAIFGFADILENRLQDAASLEYLRAIKTSGKTLLNLINDILDLSKIEAGKLELKYAPCNLESIIKDMQKIFAQELGKKSLKFDIAIDDRIPESLILDDLRIRQILLNLVGNAVKFTKEGGIKVEVLVSFCAQFDSAVNLLVKVSDTGVGIPKEQLDSIFDSFTQGTHDNVVSSAVGTGLGLSITRRLVDMMGGRIWAQSEVGVGSIFNIALKGIEVSAVNCAEPAAVDPGLSFGPAKVLIVDDLVINRSLLCEFFNGHNLLIYQACDGEEAIKVAKEEKPNLILMDLKMPKINGFEASKILKQNPETRHIPILVVTASVVNGMEGEVLKVCDEFVRKPVNRLNLFDVMKRYLPHSIINAESEEGLEPHEDGGVASFPSNSVLNKEDLGNISIESIVTIKKRMLTEDIEQLAEQICQLGKKHAYTPFLNIGKRLTLEVRNFEVEKLPVTLDSIQNLVGRIENR